MYAGRSFGQFSGRQSGRFSDRYSGRHSGRFSDRLHRPGYSHGSSRASSVYTDPPADPMYLRRVLEQRFRPLFQGFVYGGEQITNTELRQHLLDDTYRRLLPRAKLYAVMDLVDYNPNRAISYNAFVRLVMGDDTEDDRLSGSDDGTDQSLEDVSALYDICRNTTEPQDLLLYVSKYRWLPPPFFIILITIVQITVYAVYARQLTNEDSPVTALEGVPTYSKIIYDPARRYEVWRFLTYTFLHQGFIDLIFTIVLQLFFCFPVEIVFSFWRIALLYLFGTITGSLIHSISDHSTYLAGGSGGTYCILAAHFVAMIYKFGELRKTEDGPVKKVLCHVVFRMVAIVVLVIIQISLGVYRRFFAPDIVNMGIGHYCGGIFAGVILCEAFLKERTRMPWKSNAGWVNLFFFLILFGGCAVFNFLYRGYPPSDYS